MSRRRVVARAATVAALGIAATLAGCGRLRRGTPRATPTRPDSAPVVAVRPDSARPDTTRRDTTARDTTRRDTTRAAAARPRKRAADDPTSRCGEVTFDNPPTTTLSNYTDASGQVMTYLGQGVIARCRDVRNRLQSDSAEYFQATGALFLVNNVHYDEPGRVKLTSNRLTYFTKEERIVADGNVNVTLPTGTTMTGPNAEYLREAPALRERSRLTATGRPTLRVVSAPDRDSTSRTKLVADAAARDTATIIANTILDEGDSVVYASGQVQIIRPSVTATSDSAMFDQGTEIAHLVRNAEIKGQRGRPFTMSGTLIDLYSRQRDLTRVLARGAARVVSQELDLKSDTVDLRLKDSQVDRAYAWGPSRATATSPERDVVADSIEAVLPGQRIRELHAVRRAVARSVPDSTKIVSKERDVLAGDTIVARFDTVVAQKDTAKNPPVRQIVAAGNASSLFQIASSEGRTSPPGINYLRGREITVAFDSGQVKTVTATDSVTGVYLEPSTDTTADSAKARRRRTDAAATRRRNTTRPTATGRPERDETSSVAPSAMPIRDERDDAGAPIPAPMIAATATLARPRRVAAIGGVS